MTAFETNRKPARGVRDFDRAPRPALVEIEFALADALSDKIVVFTLADLVIANELAVMTHCPHDKHNEPSD